ncbi:ATP-binding protein [Microbacterium sp. A93]|uniref:GAF domain-containing sensor histidine kinase n=1 Tax=Microbacterium sp. A93 TaxID=3450716 RepID=UPI003F41CCFD
MMETELERLLGQSPEPHVIIDAESRYQYINPAAAAIISNRAGLIGEPSPFSDSRSQKFHGRLRHTRIGWTAVEFSRVPFDSEDAERFLIRFEPVHEKSRRGRQLDAIVAVAGALSETDQLDVALRRLAREVRTAADLESCALTLLDPDRRVRIAGTAGLPEDYAEKLEACRQLGAPLLTVRALEESQVIIDPQWRNSIFADERWTPLHETVRNLRIGTLIAVPLRVRDPEGKEDVVGALTVFCREDVELDHDDIAFLRAMADYAAIAISNARMFRRLRQQAAHEERLRLSRELHDSVTQELFSLSLRTRALTRRPETIADPELAEEIGDLYEQSRRALEQMRATIIRGRAVEVGPGGLVQALRAQCAGLDLPAGMTVEVVGKDEPNALPHELQDDVFLLAMEAVRNAVKHSHASRITVELARARDDPTALRVVVTDDGDGFVISRRSASAVGLDAMRERAQAHGGSLTLTTEPGHGTTVTSVFSGVYSVASTIAADARLEGIS